MAGIYLGRFRKQPGEAIDKFVDYGQWLPAGETVASTILTHAPATTPDLVLSAPSSSDNIVVGFRVSGGKSGTQYQITIRSTITDGQIVEREILYDVEEF